MAPHRPHRWQQEHNQVEEAPYHPGPYKSSTNQSWSQVKGHPRPSWARKAYRYHPHGIASRIGPFCSAESTVEKASDWYVCALHQRCSTIAASSASSGLRLREWIRHSSALHPQRGGGYLGLFPASAGFLHVDVRSQRWDLFWHTRGIESALMGYCEWANV